MDILTSLFTPLFITLSSVALALLFIQWFYIRTLYFLPQHRAKRESKQPKEYAAQLPSLSVIVYAHNDADYLQQHLPLLLKQNYPTFEVIVVSDGSTDDTADVVSAMQVDNPHLHYTFVPQDTHNISRKKLAHTLGIKAARHEVVLFTYAHAKPQSDSWLQQMGRNFLPHIDVVLGYSYIESTALGRWRYRYFDSLIHSLRYLSAAIMGNPFMAKGSNLAYRKSLFFAHKGYAKYLNLEFGEDDLFINDVTTKSNTRVELHPDSYVTCCYTNHAQVWHNEVKQRHFMARHMHNTAHTWLGMEMLFRNLFYLSLGAIALLFAAQWQLLVVVGVLYLLFLIPFVTCFWMSARQFVTPCAVVLLPLYDIVRMWVWIYYRMMSASRRSKQRYLTTAPRRHHV